MSHAVNRFVGALACLAVLCVAAGCDSGSSPRGSQSGTAGTSAQAGSGGGSSAAAGTSAATGQAGTSVGQPPPDAAAGGAGTTAPSTNADAAAAGTTGGGATDAAAPAPDGAPASDGPTAGALHGTHRHHRHGGRDAEMILELLHEARHLEHRHVLEKRDDLLVLRRCFHV